jgi:hypothetical protein
MNEFDPDDEEDEMNQEVSNEIEVNTMSESLAWIILLRIGEALSFMHSQGTFLYSSWVDCFGYLLLGCSIISVSIIICVLILLLMSLAGLHFCVGLDLVTPSFYSL